MATPPNTSDPDGTDLEIDWATALGSGSGATVSLNLPPAAGVDDFSPGQGGGTVEPPRPADPGPPPAGGDDPPLAAGRYLVGAEIGRGGVGVVHEGWDLQLQRQVAVKVLLPEHLDKPQILRRFLDEARITSRLQHPGIVPIHDLGTAPDGRPCFVMRLVRGQTLTQILAAREDTSADLPRLLAIYLPVCQAVAYAHSQGVIHRDLKPENVMVGDFGVVKVMDWGLAKVVGDPDPADAAMVARASAALAGPAPMPLECASFPGTQAGTVFGTPAYLPPEQARGEIERIDKRADVFGLGAILCEILTGRPPYTGADGHEVYKKAATAAIAEAVGRVNKCTAPLDLLTLTRWCLSPEPGDRPADAGVVVEVITSHLQASERRAETELVRFFDLSMDLFCIATTDGYFVRVNENFPRVLGYTAAELTSRPFVEFVHPDDRGRTGNETVRLADGLPCVRFTNRYRHADGHYLWLEWNAQTVPEERAVYAVARVVGPRVAWAEGEPPNAPAGRAPERSVAADLVAAAGALLTRDGDLRGMLSEFA
jgi:PAS domain S-box-containing protein